MEDHGALVYENYIGGVPFISDPDFIEAFNTLLKTYEIDVVIPTHDTITLFFAEHLEQINAKVICPEFETATICREKTKTYDLFEKDGFVPQRFSEVSNIEYPVFLKPNIGEGAKNTFLCNNLAEITYALNKIENLIITEYLPGAELTVDCFTDKNKELRFIGPRLRNRVQMGMSFNSSQYAVTDEIKHIATTINQKLRLRGLWYFQVKKDKNGNFKLLEISARIAGTMVFYRILGINFSLLSVYDILDKEISILQNNFRLVLDRSIRNRYITNIDFDTVYLDFDDTLIFQNKVNVMAMNFVYQLINEGKKIVLITKHAEHLPTTLKRYRISEDLFDSIIHLKEEQVKADFIKKEKAIFIDNAFRERLMVFKQHGIPVFDVDAIECFLR